MQEPEVEQFLDLIAENAQLKAEIASIQRFSGILRVFDRKVVRMCVDSASGEETERPGLNDLISQIRLGVPPVESAESFKQRMLAERTTKRSDAQREKLTSLKEKTVQIEAKQKEFTDAIGSIQVKVDEHQKILADSQGIKEKFVAQMEAMTANIQSLSVTRAELTERIARAQAAGIETRRRIEQAHRTLSEFSQSESKESSDLTSMRRIVGDLRSQMKQNVT
jgi:hypothetical protein